ncbi:hypothetical protein SNE40_005881 [Patella caerulea]|uniref:Uncharacterized protein n=1 Tax=Patella caerulea TaxID=87958 RepID=A0AAN8K2J2_PATCE
MASTKLPSIHNKEYDIYSKLKSCGTRYSSNEKGVESKKSDELLKKYMNSRPTEKKYDIEYKPRRDPYAMNKQSNTTQKQESYKKRTVIDRNNDVTTEHKTDTISHTSPKRQKTEPSSSTSQYDSTKETIYTTKESPQRTKTKETKRSEHLLHRYSKGKIEEKKYNVEYKPKQDPYTMNKSITYNRTKIVKQNHVDESNVTEREEKIDDSRRQIERTSYINIEQSQKASPINSPRKINKIDKAGGTPKRSTEVTNIIYSKQSPQRHIEETTKNKQTPQHQTNILMTSDVKESGRFRDDNFYDEWFLPDQYADQLKKEEEQARSNIQDKQIEVEKSFHEDYKDIKIDTDDRTPEEENYFKSIKEDLASRKESHTEEKQEVVKTTEEKTDKFDEERKELKREISETQDNYRRDVVNDLNTREESLKQDVNNTEDKYSREVEKNIEEVKNNYYQEESTETNTMDDGEKENRNKRKVKERDYFQPLPPLPIRHTKAAQKPKPINKSEKNESNSKLQKQPPVKTTKAPSNNQKEVKQYGRNKPVDKEPPRTVKYPSREELRLNSQEKESKPIREPSQESLNIPSSPKLSSSPTEEEGNLPLLTQEEQNTMDKLLQISDKCYVKASRPNIRAA